MGERIMIGIPTFEEVFAITDKVSGRAAFDVDECRAYYMILRELQRSSTVLEIGLQFGRSTSIVAQLQTPIGFSYVGIDPFIDPPEAQEVWFRLADRLRFAACVCPTKTAELSEEQRREVIGNVISVALVDGDHTAEGVGVDCDFVMPRIEPGGYLLFHDYGSNASWIQVKPTALSKIQEHGGEAAWKELPQVGQLGIFKRL
jgi:cephalosporin hydroxylase